MKKRILLIDDDPLVLKSVLNALQTQGYEMRGFKNGSEAVRAFKSEKFDLIVTDVRMPVQDGIKTLRQIRDYEKENKLFSTPVIIITGYASEDVPLDAIELGAAGYVLKPFDFDRFLLTVKKALGELHGNTPEDSDIVQMLAKIRMLVNEFQNKHEREIFENENLKQFLLALEKLTNQLERAVVKLV